MHQWPLRHPIFPARPLRLDLDLLTKGLCKPGSDCAPSSAELRTGNAIGLELDVSEARLQERGQTGLPRMEKALRVGPELWPEMSRRRHETRRSGTAAADPVLRMSEFARRFAAAVASREQLGVDLADEAIAEGNPPPAHAPQTMFQRRDMVRDFDAIIT